MHRVAIVNDVAGVARTEVAGLRAAGWDADFHEVRRLGARWPRWAKIVAAPIRLALTVPLVLRLRRGGYDVVHVHFVSQGFVGALSGRPFVLHAHGSDLHQNLRNPLYAAWTRIWLRRAARILYVTPNLTEFLAGFEDRAQLLGNPVETERFAGAATPTALRSVLVFMRLEGVKGAPAVFAVAGELSRMVSVAAMAWGPLAKDLQRAHGNVVTFLEPVTRDRVPELLARFDAVIGQMEQGVPGLSELEAMAAGRVVVMHIAATDDAPPVVDVARGEDIVAAVARLRSDAAEVARLSADGRVWVERHHSVKVHVDALIAVYRDVIERARRR